MGLLGKWLFCVRCQYFYPNKTVLENHQVARIHLCLFSFEQVANQYIRNKLEYALLVISRKTTVGKRYLCSILNFRKSQFSISSEWRAFGGGQGDPRPQHEGARPRKFKQLLQHSLMPKARRGFSVSALSSWPKGIGFDSWYLRYFLENLSFKKCLVTVLPENN